MIETGIRELRNSLSKYLKRVRAGETVVVTERGKPVARIIPAGVPSHLAELAAQGRITLGRAGSVRLPEPIRIKPGPPLSDYISEDRR